MNPDAPQAPLTLALTGSSGLVGLALLERLRQDGHRVLPLLRRESSDPAALSWRPDQGQMSPAVLRGLDAVVHLGGENIAAGRWTRRRKRLLRESRVKSTRLLAETMIRCIHPPRTLLCASAVGYYGHRPGETVDEASAAGTGFLADLARDWEAACEPARAAGIRVLNLRIGMVLSAAGGALPRMLPAFRLGLGGPLGDGRQALSWIALPDLVEAIRFCLLREDLSGSVNLVAPDVPDQAAFARALGRALGRPARWPAPAPLLRLIFGEMADLFLEGAAVEPARLQAAGFRWRHPDLDSALRTLLETSN